MFTRWGMKSNQHTINCATEKELEMRLADKAKTGYKEVRRGSYFTPGGYRKWTAVVEKVS